MSTAAFSQLRTSVFELVSCIPQGKVTTYKQLALAVGTGPRVIGKVLHTNTDSATYPCHRVVKSDGSLANGYAFGGPSAQLYLLRREGVSAPQGRIDLELFLWVPHINISVIRKNTQE